jgi:cysteinyl-tRNA synthetase
MLKIYNSLNRAKETFTPISAGKVGMYVCGMTVYDLCHVGHARFMMAFDVAYRWLDTLGYKVTYVRNVTDIDDKIIKRALERNIPIRQLTEEMTHAMHEDVAALGILPPTHEPRATQHVPQMITMISTLERKGFAYRAPNGDVNYSVRKFPGYGKLSGKSLDQLRAGERVAVLDGKRDPLDFVLWKSAKENEPEDAKWEAPFGKGRPGWHIECSAMCCAILGEHFDIHGGGMDLQFPHHENEIAQSEAATGKPFVNYWMHNGFLNVDNEKMSKSLGNFFTIRDVLKRYDNNGEILRFFMLRTHYRSQLNFSDVYLDDAKQALTRLYTALKAVPAQAGNVDWNDPQVARFRAAMNDDFNTPEAIAVLQELAKEVNTSKSSQAASLLKSLGAVLGLLQREPQDFLQGSPPVLTQTSGGSDVEIVPAGLTQSVQQYIKDRTAARKAKNFAESDRIRDELLAAGIVLEDGPAGTTWRRK